MMAAEMDLSEETIYSHVGTSEADDDMENNADLMLDGLAEDELIEEELLHLQNKSYLELCSILDQRLVHMKKHFEAFFEVFQKEADFLEPVAEKLNWSKELCLKKLGKWINVSGPPSNHDEVNVAQKCYAVVELNLKKMRGIVLALEEGVKHHFTLHPGEGERLLLHVEKVKGELAIGVVGIHLWYNVMMDYDMRNLLKHQMIDLAEEIGKLQIAPELEMSYLELQLEPSNAEKQKLHQEMFAKEYERLTKLRQQVEAMRKKVFCVTDTKAIHYREPSGAVSYTHLTLPTKA